MNMKQDDSSTTVLREWLQGDRPGWDIRPAVRELIELSQQPECKTQSLDAGALVEALEHARLFIRNGIELGCIRMPLTDEVRSLLGRLQERLDPHIDARDWGMLCDLLAAQPEPWKHRLENAVIYGISHPEIYAQPESQESACAVCDTCHGQGEVWTGEHQTFGYMSMQPPEPIMEVCPECGGEPITAPKPEPQGVELEVVAWTWEGSIERLRQGWCPDGVAVWPVKSPGCPIGLMIVDQHQHLLSTERAEAERKMAELREELDILQKQLDRFHSQSHGIPALSEIEKLRARVAELEGRQVVMPGWLQSVDSLADRLIDAGWRYPHDGQWAGISKMVDEVALLNPPQANSQESGK